MALLRTLQWPILPQETGWSSLGIHVSSCPLFKGPRTVGSENRTIPLSVQSWFHPSLFYRLWTFLPKPLHNLNINQTRTWSWDQVLMKVVMILNLAPSTPTHPNTWNIPHQQLLPEYLSCVVQGRIFFSLGHLRI